MSEDTEEPATAPPEDHASKSEVEPRDSGPMRRMVVRMSEGDIARFDALVARMPGMFRAALVRAFCVTAGSVPQESHHGEEALTALADVMQKQARLVRAEASVLAARRHLNGSVRRFKTVVRSWGAVAGVSPSVADALLLDDGKGSLEFSDMEQDGTLRDRIVTAIEANPGQVFTSARVATTIGASNRDSVRNTLLVLAAKDRIEKVGEGQYQALEKAKP